MQARRCGSACLLINNFLLKTNYGKLLKELRFISKKH